MNRKHLLVIVLVLLATAVISLVLVARSISRTVQRAYDLKNTNLLLIDYVCEHKAWPGGWEALADSSVSFEQGVTRDAVMGLRDTVAVNWDPDLAALLATAPGDDRSHFTTTSLRGESDMKWEDPNDEIYFGITGRCPPPWASSDDGEGD